MRLQADRWSHWSNSAENSTLPLSQAAMHPPISVEIDTASKERYTNMSSVIIKMWCEADKVLSLTITAIVLIVTRNVYKLQEFHTLTMKS